MKAIMKYQTSERWPSAQSERLNDFMASDPVRYGLVVLGLRLWIPAVTTRTPGESPSVTRAPRWSPTRSTLCSDTVLAG